MYARFAKRAADLLFSVLTLPALGLVFLIVAPAILLDDRGPIFYVGQRIGRKGKLFGMYKFRTMKVNAPDIRFSDGSTYNAEDDPRLTRVGKLLRKTSLDELPQILNILRGEMSLIGPRPDPPDWLARYPEDVLGFLDAKPGISGYAQAYYRNSCDSTQKMYLDLHYAKNISFLMDAKVFFKTIATVLSASNVYRAPERHEED